jgi:UDP-N-acetylmuramoyl-tripeptide--D-alanyl-D-alanine ligase
MPSFDPQHIAQWTDGSWRHAPNLPIHSFCFDARQVQPGQCFVALRGGERDGHDFIEQAAAGGAAAAIVETPKVISLPQLQVADSLLALGAIGAAVRSQFQQPVVAITGSCGKTSTKEMLRVLLGEKHTHATAGNWNNRIGVPMTLLGLDTALQDYAVIEAGINQPDEMQALGEMIRADLNILTNIAPAHLELLGDLDHVAVEKSLLVKYARPGSPIILPAEALQYSAYSVISSRVIALLPVDAEAPDVPVRELIRYAIRSTDGGQQELVIAEQTYLIASSSRGIAANAALAIVAAKNLGISEADIRKRIQAWRPAGNRGRIESFADQCFYIDCYNANPASMVDALEAFRLSTSPDVARLYILGAMNELGEHAIGAHVSISHQLTLRPQDRAAFVGPPELTQAYASALSPKQCVVAESFQQIKPILASFKGAIFLKGSRSYQLEKLLPESLISA